MYSYSEFEFIFQNTPKTGDISYGTQALTSNLEKHSGIVFNNYLLSILLIFLVLLIYIFFHKKIFNNLNYKNEEMFLSGGSIYCATFLIGSNHDYRMIFLIFLLPLILNLNFKLLKYLILICTILSLEVHRLIYFSVFMEVCLITYLRLFYLFYFRCY